VCVIVDLLRDVEAIEIDDQTEERLHRGNDEPRNAWTIAPEPPPEQRDDDSSDDENKKEAKHVMRVCHPASTDCARGE